MLLHAVFIFFLSVFSGCTSAPPLEDWERFQLTVKKGAEPNHVFVTIKAKNFPPKPFGHILAGKIRHDGGDATVELIGWRGPQAEGEVEGTLIADITIRAANVSFKFTLSLRGHEDEYRVIVPPSGDPTIEPAAGEFSERG
ncbi:MAG: hypothetical protein ACAI25_04740 [Planctomycetota bacterium]